MLALKFSSLMTYNVQKRQYETVIGGIATFKFKFVFRWHCTVTTALIMDTVKIIEIKSGVTLTSGERQCLLSQYFETFCYLPYSILSFP